MNMDKIFIKKVFLIITFNIQKMKMRYLNRWYHQYVNTIQNYGAARRGSARNCSSCVKTTISASAMI